MGTNYGITFSSGQINWSAAQAYVQTWKQGDTVKWAGSRWHVAEVTASGALLTSGTIKLRITFADVA